MSKKDLRHSGVTDPTTNAPGGTLQTDTDDDEGWNSDRESQRTIQPAPPDDAIYEPLAARIGQRSSSAIHNIWKHPEFRMSDRQFVFPPRPPAFLLCVPEILVSDPLVHVDERLSACFRALRENVGKLIFLDVSSKVDSANVDYVSRFFDLTITHLGEMHESLDARKEELTPLRLADYDDGGRIDIVRMARSLFPAATIIDSCNVSVPKHSLNSVKKVAPGDTVRNLVKLLDEYSLEATAAKGGGAV